MTRNIFGRTGPVVAKENSKGIADKIAIAGINVKTTEMIDERRIAKLDLGGHVNKSQHHCRGVVINKRTAVVFHFEATRPVSAVGVLAMDP